MNKRIRKKKILDGLSKEERYRRTHCPVCDDKIGVFEWYFNRYGFALSIVVMNTTAFHDYKKSQHACTDCDVINSNNIISQKGMSR
ncbi:TPA: hypothetical protein TZC38_001249 [Streptococcus suis]|nr:hypothetical protein [Streptococcus suis]